MPSQFARFYTGDPRRDIVLSYHDEDDVIEVNGRPMPADLLREICWWVNDPARLLKSLRQHGTIFFI